MQSDFTKFYLFIYVLRFSWQTVLQATIAKLETSVSVFSDKLELKVYGFNNKLPVLLSKLLATAKSFLPTEDRFEVSVTFDSHCYTSCSVFVCFVIISFF